VVRVGCPGPAKVWVHLDSPPDPLTGVGRPVPAKALWSVWQDVLAYGEAIWGVADRSFTLGFSLQARSRDARCRDCKASLCSQVKTVACGT